MNSQLPCPACTLPLAWIPLHAGYMRLYCADVNCHDRTCGAGVEVDTRWGQDNQDAHRELVRLFEKMKGKAA